MNATSSFRCVCCFLVLGGIAAGADSLTTYDTFGADFINPAKWLAFSPCNTNSYDCVREQRQGALQLGLRSYGSNSSDSGISFSASELQFINPSPITTIQVKAVIDSFSSSACSTNPEAAHPQFLISGTFFNAGSGNGQDDVQAFVMIERRTDDPQPPATTLRVAAFMFTEGSFFNNVDLGTVEVDEDATLTLKWDKPNKQFIAQIVRTETAPFFQQQVMTYGQSDSLPPSFLFKSVRVGTFTPNCTTSRAFAAMKARVKAVKVNAGGF